MSLPQTRDNSVIGGWSRPHTTVNSAIGGWSLPESCAHGGQVSISKIEFAGNGHVKPH